MSTNTPNQTEPSWASQSWSRPLHWSQEFDNSRREVLLLDPAVTDYINSVPYPMVAREYLGKKRSEHAWVESVDDVRFMYEAAIALASTPQPAVIPEAPPTGRTTKKLPAPAIPDEVALARAAHAKELEQARREWKDAVDRRKQVLAELDADVKVKHDRFTELRNSQ